MNLKEKVDIWLTKGKALGLSGAWPRKLKSIIPFNCILLYQEKLLWMGLSYFPLFLKEQEIDFEEIMETESDMYAFLLNEEGETILQVPLSYGYYCTNLGSLSTKVRYHYNTQITLP